MRGMNKKGADKVLSVYWFAILAIVAGGITAMVFTFYNSPYDIRELEADILSEKISECLSPEGVLSERFLESSESEINLQKECNIIFNEEYYLEVDIKDFDSGNSVSKIVSGNPDIKADCNIQEEEKFGSLARCSENRFYSVDGDNNQYSIKIIAGIRKTNENAR